MALAQTISQKQSQTLAMTPELQQSLKMLQLSSLDLTAFINAEMEKNPLLADGDSDYENVEVSSSADTSEMELGELGDNRDLQNSNESMDFDYSSNWDDVGNGGNSKFESMDFDFDRTLEGEKNLIEDLTENFFLDVEDQQKRMLGVYMMDFLDESGYFIGNLEEIADNFGCDKDDVEEVLLSLQKLEPSGVFARDLAECLSIQLRDLDRLDPAMFSLVSNLELLGQGRLDLLADICETDHEELLEMAAELRALNPKPALGYKMKEMTPSAPDIYIRKTDDGSFSVEVNNAALPKVLADKTYYTEISQNVQNKDEKKYISQQWQSANFLIRAIDQRANTMLKTASAIVKHQQDFFKFGIKYLKPLTLAQIAEEIEMHESTVSRVTSNKYMQTPRGAFDMKFFFTSGVSNSAGEIASTSVKETIKEIVDAEDKKKPMSDDAIAKELKKRSIKISRRTVMKYREAMGIESSYERKNMLNLG